MSDRWLYAWGLGSAAFGGVSVIVPLYVVSLGADPFTLGILAAAAAFAGVPGALAFGGLADRTGKRRGFVVAALSLVAVMSVAITFTRSIAVVIAANATVWFASAAVLPILTLLAVADAPDAQWSERIARLNTYQGVGWALGLLAGTVWTVGAAQVLGRVAAQRGFLLACAACAALCCLASVRTLPPTLNRARNRNRGHSGARCGVRVGSTSAASRSRSPRCASTRADSIRAASPTGSRRS